VRLTYQGAKTQQRGTLPHRQGTEHTHNLSQAGTRIDQFLCGKDPMALKVFSQGAAVCTYDLQEREDADGNKSKYWEKDVFEFVDFVDFMLTKEDGSLVAKWRVPGDSYDEQSPLLDTDMFSYNMEQRKRIKVTSKSGFDSTLCLLLGHIVTLEYSVNQIKSDFRPSFPQSP